MAVGCSSRVDAVTVCLLVAFVSNAKTAEPIEMPFGWMGPGTMY